jgi:porin
MVRNVGAGAACLMAALHAASSPAQVGRPSAERTPGNVEVSVGGPADPLTLEVSYVADTFTSVVGGRRRGTRYIDNVDIIASADLDYVVGIPRTVATIHAFHNNGKSFSGSVVGDAQVISSIEAGYPVTRLHEAWVEHRGEQDRWSIKLGLYDINSEFDSLETSLLFIHSAHGMGTDISQSGRSGPSTFPSTSLALRGEVRVNDRLSVRAAILDGVPNDPARPRRTLIRFGPREGALVIGEADAAFGSMRVIAGGWRYSAASDNRYDSAVGAAIVRQSHSAGAYVRGEAQLSGTAERGMRGFARFGVADGRANQFDRFASAGLVWRGLVRARPDDATGIAVAFASAGSASERLAQESIGTADPGEVVFELTHRIKLTDWLSLQPDVQYIVHPGLDPDLKDAVAVGFRLSASLGL